MLAMLLIILYSIRMLVLGIALGTSFIRLNLFRKMSNGQTMVIGIVSTPMFMSLIDYLLGLIFIGGGSAFYFFAPIVLSGLFMGVKKNYVTAINACKKIYVYCVDYLRDLGNGLIWDIFFASSVTFGFLLLYNGISVKIYISDIYYSSNTVGRLVAVILLLTSIAIIIVEFHKWAKNGILERNIIFCIFLIIIGTSSAHALSMISRPDMDSDRAHYELNARYFLEDKNSWEVDNYTGEKYGSSYRDDHGALWTIYLADAYMVSDTMRNEDSLRSLNFAIFWVYLCFNIFLFISASYGAGTYRAGIISLVLFHLYEHTLLMIAGSRDAFRFAALILLVIFLLNQIENISTGKAGWFVYVAMLVFCYLSINGHEGNVYIMFGMFVVVGVVLLVMKTQTKPLIVCGLSVLLGTLFGIRKTISIFLNTGRLFNPVMLTFHDTPVVEQMAQIKANRTDISAVLETYTIPVRLMMLLGIIGLLVMTVASWKNKRREDLIFSLIIWGMLIPMTGILDWMGYEVSMWFIVQIRYRMYFLMLFAITGAWLLSGKGSLTIAKIMASIIFIFTFVLFLRTEIIRYNTINRWEVQIRINQRDDYIKIADIISSVTDGDAFTRDQVLLLYLHGTPRLLYHPYAEDLIQAKMDEEIEVAVEKLNIGAIILPQNGLDNHDYSLLPFWDYINNSDNFSQIGSEDRDDTVDKTIFYRKIVK